MEKKKMPITPPVPPVSPNVKPNELMHMPMEKPKTKPNEMMHMPPVMPLPNIPVMPKPMANMPVMPNQMPNQMPNVPVMPQKHEMVAKYHYHMDKVYYYDYKCYKHRHHKSKYHYYMMKKKYHEEKCMYYLHQCGMMESSSGYDSMCDSGYSMPKHHWPDSSSGGCGC